LGFPAVIAFTAPTIRFTSAATVIEGQSPVNIARQLYLSVTGERAGSWAPLMKNVVEKLTNDDIVAISSLSLPWSRNGRFQAWPLGQLRAGRELH
jgi:hypothetical protein